MNRFLLILATMAVTVMSANACDGVSFAQSHCYSAAVVAPAYSYAAPLVLPLQSYAAPAQYLTLPTRVQIVRPEVRLQVAQVHGYAYAAPVVVKQQAIVQKQVVVRQVAPQRVRSFELRGPFGGGISRQVVR